MTNKEVMQMALETAEQIASADYRHWEELASLGEFERWARSRANHIAEALRTALAQPDVPESCFGEAEPVAWVSDREARMVWWNDKFTHISQAPPRNTPLYTAPPQREWVGLTDAEAMEIEDKSPDIRWAIIQSEAKLKEKNS